MAEYLIRHGESEANVRGVFAGQRDNSPLTEKGRQQAREAAKKLKDHYHISRLVASPLRRAAETAEIIAALMNGVEIQFDERIAEYDMGDLSGTPIRSVSPKQLLLTPNAEDPVHFAQRVCSCLFEYVQRGSNTLFISHGGTYKIIQTIISGKDLAEFDMLSALPNSEVIEINTEIVRNKAKDLPDLKLLLEKP